MFTLHSISQTLPRIVSVIVLVCLVTATASAYTIVMRGGRRIEIPSNFTVTASTLTYEVSPGVQVTLNLAAIDIAATETANKEVSGSFIKRIPATLMAPQSRVEKNLPAPRAGTATRTITNRDLESARRRRHESELTYERRRKELGLPSVEESRRETAAESESILRDLERTRASERESENYWRERASALRTELAVVDAEIGYVRSQLEEPLFSNGSGSFINGGGIIPFVSFGNTGRHGPFSNQGIRQRVFGPPRTGPQLSGRVSFGGGSSRGQEFFNPRRFDRTRQFGLPLFASPTVFAPFDNSYERGQLITRFNELGTIRAGLTARWSQLEDEARRAGAPPGWLRP